jgi:MoaA/NifB/PqqE/SkfB family radical SAM enzyme
MNVSDAIKAGPTALRALLGGRAVPLIVGWYLTYRCNRSCDFCGVDSAVGPELDTDQVKQVLDRLAQAGTRLIVFSGGEPLMRKDIGQILQHSKSLGIRNGLTTNGTLVPERIDEIAEYLDNVKVSFDGPESIHDRIRGAGSFAEVMTATDLLLAKGVRLLFNTTLCKPNIDSIDEVLDIAKGLGVRVKFQPVSSAHTMGKNIQDMIPEVDSFLRVVKTLRQMRKTNPTIANSDAALEYMESWPKTRPIKCHGSTLFLRLGPDGQSFFCTMQRTNFAKKNILEHGVEQTMRSLARESCAGCWCTSSLELNLFLEKGWKRPWQILRFLR